MLCGTSRLTLYRGNRHKGRTRTSFPAFSTHVILVRERDPDSITGIAHGSAILARVPDSGKITPDPHETLKSRFYIHRLVSVKIGGEETTWFLTRKVCSMNSNKGLLVTARSLSRYFGQGHNKKGLCPHR